MALLFHYAPLGHIVLRFRYHQANPYPEGAE